MRISLVCVLALVPWSALAVDLDLPQDQVDAGRILFQEKCARCHGRDASGGNAPDIQGILARDVTEAARGVEAMPDIALSEAEAGQIAVFLMSLAPDQACLRLSIRRKSDSVPLPGDCGR